MSPACFGVACHPHPLYGGTMDNKVTHVIARSMLECGAPALRFNFRGVGASAGQFDNGRGEADDLAAVVAEGRRRYPSAALVVRRLLVRRVRGAAGRRDPGAGQAHCRGATRGALRARQTWRTRIATGCWCRGMRTTWCRPDAVLAWAAQQTAANRRAARARRRRAFLSRQAARAQAAAARLPQVMKRTKSPDTLRRDGLSVVQSRVVARATAWTPF